MYKINKVSEILNVHPKTVRRYIKEGKLNAVKAGGQWRVSKDNIIEFLGEKSSYEIKEDIKEKGDNVCIQVSSVVTFDNCSKSNSERIISTVYASMNGKTPENVKARCDATYDKDEKKLRLMLWGSTKFMVNTLEMISEIS